MSKVSACHLVISRLDELIADGSEPDPCWKCSRCAKTSCFMCRGAGHKGETCEQSRKLNPQREEVEAARRKACKKCPKKGCGRYIHKIRGCTHMTCTKCMFRLFLSAWCAPSFRSLILRSSRIGRMWFEVLLEMQGYISNQEGKI